MKRMFLTIIALMLLVCCHNTRRQNIVDSSRADTVDIFRHVFKSGRLQYSLDAFVAETQFFTGYDTLTYSVYVFVPDLYPPGTIKECPDTIVSFIMDDEIWYEYNPSKPETCVILGAASQENRIIGVSYCGISDSDILNENDYEKGLWQRYYMRELMKTNCDINVLGMTCMNNYLLVGKDSLVFLRRHRHKRFFENMSSQECNPAME
ncbi:MAG: hypothetical protein NC115_10955 [Bacteroidales bacterium]|nr:hypothetical protein [Bacteroidales bacterium]